MNLSDREKSILAKLEADNSKSKNEVSSTFSKKMQYPIGVDLDSAKKDGAQKQPPAAKWQSKAD